MEKVSAEQVQQVLEATVEVLPKLAANRDFWRDIAQQFIRRDEIQKVAHAMAEKGLLPEGQLGDILESLEKKASDGTLAEFSRAVDLVAPDMGSKLASLGGSAPGADTPAARFEAFLAS